MHSRTSLFEELSRYAGQSSEHKAENAYNVAVRFLEHMKNQFPDERTYDFMMKAWFRAIKDEDFSKFMRIYRKYSKTT